MECDFTRRHIVSALALSPTLLIIDCGESQAAGDKKPVSATKAEGLRAYSGLTIRNRNFNNLGNGAIRVNRATSRLTIENCRGNGLYRFLENTASKRGAPASLSNFTLRRITARNVQRGMTRIRYASHDGLIEDVIANASQNPVDYCVGFALDDEAHDIIYRRAEAHGFAVQGLPNDRYWNGDGFSDERGNYGIRYIDCIATGSSDGGFDLKSARVVLENCMASGNKRNYRLWGNGRLTKCRSENPRRHGGTGRPAHFSFHGGTARYVIDRPVVRARPGNKAPVFLFNNDQPAIIEIRDADIDAPGAPLIVSEKVKPIVRFVPPLAKQKIRTA